MIPLSGMDTQYIPLIKPTKGILIINHIPGLLSSIHTKQLRLHIGSIQST
ncbi:hypothetical protein [Myroides odoratus]|nr:hypothetical protein [Myroides odoratus]WQD57997.1 hypothetical protein U0010_02235 [Myroides odoratus]